MQKRQQIPTYNALKGLGAIGILASHMSYLSDSTNLFWKIAYEVFLSKGAICTTLFVLFSGFFLCYTWKEIGFKSYIIGKLKRIYPLTLLVFLAAIAVDILFKNNGIVNDTPLGSKQWIFNVFANVFLFKAFIPIESTFYSFHGPSWYISFLFVFYIIAFPFVKQLHGNKKKYGLKLLREWQLLHIQLS